MRPVVALTACAALAGACSFITTVDDLSRGGPVDASLPDVGDVLPETGPGSPDAAADDAPAQEDARPDATDAGDAAEAAFFPSPDPGKVHCGPGQNPCAVGDNQTFCCEYPDASQRVCLVDEGACPYVETFCDEQSDCANGHPCCLALDNAGDFVSSFCYAQCMNPPNHVGVPVCKTSAECPGGQTCRPAQCRDRIYYTCNGLLPDAGCN
jgi:hypothetical protein